MYQVGFDNQKYIETQSAHIKERIEQFGGKLYLEFGGKLFDDYHASRVLPGFAPDSKIRMLSQLKDQAEIIIAINANDIQKNKVRGDLGITYDLDVLRLIDAFRSLGLYVGSVVMTRWQEQPNAVKFAERLKSTGVAVYRHYPIEGYPSDIEFIVSDEGYGRNDYVVTERPLAIVTAPGPGSGKMAVCLSQLYHDQKRGIRSGYAKFETFPIWNLPLKHPVNLAYEAATADLNDLNMIDPYHLEAYGKLAVNYNRDVEIFPVLDAMLKKICGGEAPYKSPTDMGVNMAGNCIVDDAVVRRAAEMEIVRRYFTAKSNALRDASDSREADKIQMIMQSAGIDEEFRTVALKAREKAELTSKPACAIELQDGRIVTGRTSRLLGAASAALLNALKVLGNIDDRIDLIAPEILEPITNLKVGTLGSKNPRLHPDETLIALSISALTNEYAKKAVEMLGLLRHCEMHSTVILSAGDEHTLKKLGILLTSDAQYESKRLFHG